MKSPLNPTLGLITFLFILAQGCQTQFLTSHIGIFETMSSSVALWEVKGSSLPKGILLVEPLPP